MFVPSDWGRETSTIGDSPLSIYENGLEREGAVSKGLADTTGNAAGTTELAEFESFAEEVEKMED